MYWFSRIEVPRKRECDVWRCFVTDFAASMRNPSKFSKLEACFGNGSGKDELEINDYEIAIRVIKSPLGS